MPKLKIALSYVVAIILISSVALGADFYVDAEGGNNSNTGLSPGDAWLTISHALSSVEGSPDDPVTIHIAAGTYSASANGDKYPLKMKSWVSLVGDDQETTILDAEKDAYHVIYCNGVNDLSIEGLTIAGGMASGNSDEEKRGGGIFCSFCSSLIIKKNTIKENLASLFGGGIHCHGSSPTISDNIISNNYTYGAGGGMYCKDSSPTVTNNIISGNHAGCWGGGINCHAGGPSISNNVITENSAAESGGGIFCVGDATISNNEICHNYGGNSGGGIKCVAGSPAIKSNMITDNSTKLNGFGGGIMCSVGLISGNTISGNDAGFGAGIYCYNGSPTIENNTIRENSAEYVGGGVYCKDSSPIIQHNTISRNSGEGGGGIHCRDSSPTISNNTIASNSAYEGGGGVHFYSCWSTIDNNTITGNSAYEGGGIYCYRGSSTMSNNIITENSAEYVGGGIYCEESSPTIQNNAIEDNSAFHGGGICCKDSSPTILNNRITSNSADNSGGGIFYSSYSSPTISNNTISGNSAGYHGGGLYCGTGCWPTIQNNTITGNSAEHHGGGIYCNYGSPTIENNTITGNSAKTKGGGIYCNCDSSPTILNNTIGANSAQDGGGISCYQRSSPTISNNTITGNSARTNGGGISCDYQCSPTVINSILWGDSPNEVFVAEGSSITITYSDVEGGWEGEGNISEDPLFVEGYYLSQTAAGQGAQSPCVDAGDGDASEYRLDTYTTRTDQMPDSGIVDMGYHYPLTSDEGPTIECFLNADEFFPGDQLVGLYDIDNPGPDITVDVYVAFVMPDGAILCVSPTRIDFGIFPYQTDLFLPQGYSMEPTPLVSLGVPGGLEGDFLFAAALSRPDEFEVIGNLSLFPFTLRAETLSASM